MEYPSQYEKLLAENEDLKTRLTDLLFEMNYNKQTELIEFLREIYDSVIMEMEEIDISSRMEYPSQYEKLLDEILYSLKKSIEEFARNNNINIVD